MVLPKLPDASRDEYCGLANGAPNVISPLVLINLHIKYNEKLGSISQSSMEKKLASKKKINLKTFCGISLKRLKNHTILTSPAKIKYLVSIFF